MGVGTTHSVTPLNLVCNTVVDGVLWHTNCLLVATVVTHYTVYCFGEARYG